MAARAIWKGVIRLGDVALPVKLYSAVEDRKVHFRLLHDRDTVPIKQRMVDEGTGEPVERSQMQKAVEVGPDAYVVLQPEELDELEPPPSRDITLERFVPPSEINHQWYVRPYYLGPDGEDASRDYFSLAAALEKRGVEGVARWTMRKKRYVGALRVEGGYLMLVTLRHTGEVVHADQLEPPTGRDLEERELRMAEQLVTALEDRFEPERWWDEYRERVLAFVQSKAQGRAVEAERPPAPRERATSLAGMLEMSLADAKERRRG